MCDVRHNLDYLLNGILIILFIPVLCSIFKSSFIFKNFTLYYEAQGKPILN